MQIEKHHNWESPHREESETVFTDLQPYLLVTHLWKRIFPGEGQHPQKWTYLLCFIDWGKDSSLELAGRKVGKTIKNWVRHCGEVECWQKGVYSSQLDSWSEESHLRQHRQRRLVRFKNRRGSRLWCSGGEQRSFRVALSEVDHRGQECESDSEEVDYCWLEEYGARGMVVQRIQVEILCWPLAPFRDSPLFALPTLLPNVEAHRRRCPGSNIKIPDCRVEVIAESGWKRRRKDPRQVD